MKCPKCNVTLLMSDKQGIEIDYCPECRGVWLDRGELDKIIERSNTSDSFENRSGHYKKDEHKHHGDYHDSHYKYGKRKSFLSELFD